MSFSSPRPCSPPATSHQPDPLSEALVVSCPLEGLLDSVCGEEASLIATEVAAGRLPLSVDVPPGSQGGTQGWATAKRGII